MRHGGIHGFRENANFIRKTLAHAQVSCSSLLLSLWYIDQIFQQSCPHHQPDWSTRDLFIAGIVVADKFLADVCWTNADWVINTNYAYQLNDINRLERRFLRALNYRLYVPSQAYMHFCSFLEFRLIAAGAGTSWTFNSINTMSHHHGGLSYRDIRILSESLPKIYADRLRLSLRPLEAMWLMARTVAAICAVYVTAVATGYALRAYIVQVVQYTLYQRQLQEQAMVMMVDALGKMALTHIASQKLMAPSPSPSPSPPRLIV
ncbi:hypothetical protein O0I10_002438 [Lichtheimia ornata]|uniref:Cyclin N-terminal domain-containing protein n=1 Tax=Lichtheimia ornata TaxID=688661 RepID=A0AAD7VCC2_9FUNG|nr:uncharacterized protein O0I10_002438 [Lichtheimia ornata]KAJ8661631.1 hypothetical protein O0I10_002438 [Lichtheimia ornata]